MRFDMLRNYLIIINTVVLCVCVCTCHAIAEYRGSIVKAELRSLFRLPLLSLNVPRNSMHVPVKLKYTYKIR